ncbi:MAG TPA: CBS domain-containing protein [Polyangiales bacterium]
MRVEQVMSRPAAVCRTSDTLNLAAQLMWDHDCGCVPVVDQAGTAIAMVTDRDVCMAAYTQGKALGEICVADAMSRELFVCSGSEPLSAAEEIMRMRQLRRLPVTDSSGMVIGVISLNDIAVEAERERGRRSKEVTSNEVGAVLGKISRHRQSVSLTALA